MSNDEAKSIAASTTPQPDARSLVRLVQCSRCSHPYRNPVTLPCGKSLCRQCLPPSHVRENISYPDLPGRASGITCPFAKCSDEHSLSDCSVDVVLLKVMESIAAEVEQHRSGTSNVQIHLEEMPGLHDPDNIAEKETPSDEVVAGFEKAHSRTLSGGRFAATYEFAEMGELHYTSEVSYGMTEGGGGDDGDEELVATLRAAIQEKLECHVCYNLLLDPVTTTCGHTFCRKCLAQVLDHSMLCPHCRRKLSLPPILAHQPGNTTLGGVLRTLYPDELELRRQVVEREERSAPDGMDTALFVCTVAYPQMPIILHIFEPRYRLMIRRALETNRQFGMVAYNEHHVSQGSLGRTHFCDTGTMLYIEQCQILNDGRSFLICRGMYRFKVLAHGTLDGYVVGRIQRHDDVALAEEERIEAEETTSPPVDENDAFAQIDRMPTGEIFRQCQSFLQRAQAQSARWLQGNIQSIYGPPPTDAALFPYWFASVVPLPDDKKHTLLPTSTVRDRLKITLIWIKKIESNTWWNGTNSCVAL